MNFHYQLQGTWTTSTGKDVNYLVIKETLNDPFDVSCVYFNIEDLKFFKGVSLSDLDNCNEANLHISLINLITEFPTSELVAEIFRLFLSQLQPLTNVHVNQQLNKTRTIQSFVPKIQLKIDRSDEENEDNWQQRQNENTRARLDQVQAVSKCDKFQECTKLGTSGDLLEHDSSSNEWSNKKGKMSFQCDKCPKTFSSKNLRLKHSRIVHKIQSKNINIRSKPASFICPTCGEKKNSDHNLAQHIKKFHENAFPEPVVCNLCGDLRQLRNRKYHTPYSYELHMRQIHSGGSEGKVVCEYCCKEFIGSIGKCKFALKEHIHSVHLGIRPECDECGKSFASKIVLNKHKKHVHRKLVTYPCKGCGKIFKYIQQAIDHEYKDRGLQPYSCKYCAYKTADNWAIAKHKKVCVAAAEHLAVVENNVLPALNLAL